MKKISTLLGLLFALALIGAGFASCSDDDDEDTSPSLTVAAESAVSVTAGEKIDATLTATLKNDSFAAAIAAEEDLSEFVTITPSDTASFSDDLKITAAEAVAEGATSAKVKVSVTTTTVAKTGTITFTIKAAALKSGKDLTSNTVAYTIKTTGGSESVLWKFSDYATELGATAVSTAVGEAKTCGIVVMGKNVKIRSDGDGVSGTITEGVTGYCQLSNGKDGALLLTVPAGTSKITLGAKNTNGLKIVANDGSTVIKTFDAEANSNYANYEYEPSFAAETKVYIGPFEASKTCNFKAIKLE